MPLAVKNTIEQALLAMSAKMYRMGFRDGLTAFAHWKDGVQYVGTSGTTLAEALKEMDNMWNFRLPTIEDTRTK